MIIGILLTLFNPLFINNNVFLFTSLMSILLIYKNNNIYHLNCFIIGLFMDLISSTIFINAFLYLFISFIIRYFITYKKDNIKNRIIILLFTIFIYNTFLYLIFNLFKITTYNYISLFYYLIIIYIENILLYLILFLIIKLYKKHKIYW